MNVNLPNIKTKALNGLNSIGTTAYTIKDKAIDLSKQAKDKVVSSDMFIKASNTLKDHGVEKKTLVGGAVLVCALALAAKTVKGVAHKIKEMKAK